MPIAELKDIRNWLRLSDKITTSGKLDPKDPARLAAIGVKRVINLALADHAEALPNAEAVMAQAGLEYTHIPVAFDAPEEAHYQSFTRALEAEDTPVHVHCIMNYRVSAFFYRYNLQACGMDQAEAISWIESIWSPHKSERPEIAPWRAFMDHIGE